MAAARGAFGAAVFWASVRLKVKPSAEEDGDDRAVGGGVGRGGASRGEWCPRVRRSAPRLRQESGAPEGSGLGASRRPRKQPAQTGRLGGGDCCDAAGRLGAERSAEGAEARRAEAARVESADGGGADEEKNSSGEKAVRSDSAGGVARKRSGGPGRRRASSDNNGRAGDRPWETGAQIRQLAANPEGRDEGRARDSGSRDLSALVDVS